MRRIISWAAIWSAVGFLTYVFYPELLPQLLKFLEEVFKEILGEEKFVISFATAFEIFKNNLTAAFLAIVFGIFLGLAPLLAVAVNFFIIGFLLSVFIFSGQAHYFFLAIAPHGILELPAVLIASALGLRLGFFWWRPPAGRSAGKNFISIIKQILSILPLIVILFFAAALIEVFITGNVLEWISKGLRGR